MKILGDIDKKQSDLYLGETGNGAIVLPRGVNFFVSLSKAPIWTKCCSAAWICFTSGGEGNGNSRILFLPMSFSSKTTSSTGLDLMSGRACLSKVSNTAEE